MSQVIDMVKAAEERQYTKFEEMAREMLLQKVAENPDMQRMYAELKEAKGEEDEPKKKDIKNSEDEDEDEDEEVDEAEKEYEIDEYKAEELMAQSGKSTVKQMLDYMKSRYEGMYDVKLARKSAKEMVAGI